MAAEARGRDLEASAAGEPMSPAGRLFREKHFNCYVVAVIGLGTAVDVAAARAGLEATLIRHPRFSSIQVNDDYARKSAKPRWVRTTVNLDDHIIVPAATSTTPDQAVEDYLSWLSTAPMDHSRPLWELHVLDFPSSEATATVAFRMHHSLGDGVSLLSLLIACTRSAADPARLPELPPAPRRAGPVYARPRPPLSAGLVAFVLWLWSYVVLAWHTLLDVVSFVATAWFLRDPRTPFMAASEGVEFRRKRFVHRTLSLDDVKFVKNAMKCTVNDVLIGVTNAGLSRYYFRKTSDTNSERKKSQSIRIRSALYVNIRKTPGLHALSEMMDSGKNNGAKWGNLIGYMILPFHIAMHDDPLEYIRQGKKTAERKKASLEAVFTYWSATLIDKLFGMKLLLMEEAKSAAVVEFCRAAGQSREAVHAVILSVAEDARRCYGGDYVVLHMDNNEFVHMMLRDGCFLVQFMVSMMRSGVTSPELDPLMSRAEVHRSIDAIAQDILLLENQIPWVVLERLTQLRPVVPVDGFLSLMASAFEIGNINNNADDDSTRQDQGAQGGEETGDHDQTPPHLLGLFHRRQMGAARTQSLRVPILSSLYTTAVELAEMGVKLTASKTNKFGDMAMTKRRRRLGLFGELTLAPVVLNELTACWLFNMAAYEACLGVTSADNFAVSSYVTLASILMNRREDVQEMRAKGLVVSALDDECTLGFFKWLAPHLQVGHRYYDVFQSLQEYRKERWLWIAVHRFLYKNIKTIVGVLSVVGVLAGLFKTILSLKQPQR